MQIKYVYRMQGDTVGSQLYVDGEETPETDGGKPAQQAKQFLETFYPERLLRAYVEVLGENTLLVFRTDDTQMGEFAAFLKENR